MESEQKSELKRIALHHQIVPPNSRTSRPHAESHEEEFFYVLKGTPDVWINGYVQRLKPHMAVGFPAGTGIFHTVLNNTNEDVHILVIGEKTKPENKCAFSHNPEMKNDPIWWDGPPQELGTGPMPDSLAKYIVDISTLTPGESFHYPGDSETFGNGIRLTDLLDLKALGIWHEVLPPGHRSSWPHSHLHDEEFAYIVQGKVKVWLNGHVTEAGAGSKILFPPNTNIAHCLINDSDEPVVYIGGGETPHSGRKEKVHYPMHELRNQQCRELGFYWEDRPAVLGFGPHDGRPAAQLSINPR